MTLIQKKTLILSFIFNYFWKAYNFIANDFLEINIVLNARSK